MPKINPKADIIAVKGWASSHVLFFAAVALVIGFALGHVIH